MSEPKTLREAIAAIDAELWAKKASADGFQRSLDTYKQCSGSGGPRDGCWYDEHSRRFCERHKYLEGVLEAQRLPAITLEIVATRIEQALKLPDGPEASEVGSDSAARPT